MWPLSLIYLSVIWIRRRYIDLFYKHASYRAPVVVVGNLTTGGTGKTPLVIALVSELKKRGFTPGVVSRGYGGHSTTYPLSVTTETSPKFSGDEPLLIAKSNGCPVVVDPDRSNAINHLLNNFDCNVVLSDDGLQHYRMHRDIEMIVMDGARGFGNGYCLPAGPLREPETRLAQVDFVVINSTQCEKFETGNKKLDKFSLSPIIFRNLSTGDTKIIGEWCKNTSIHAVAAIGAPERFQATLSSLGFNVTLHAYDDHRVLSPEELSFGDDLDIIITAKDAVKLRPNHNTKIWVLEVKAEIKTDLVDRLEARLVALSEKQLSSSIL